MSPSDARRVTKPSEVSCCQFTKTFGLPLTLESVMGPYLAVKNPAAKHADGPDDKVNFCLEKLFVLPVFDAVPEMLFAV